jgi:catechol 2,3-dioxygenase-like lactoylglutathione lyase family enzyme
MVTEMTDVIIYVSGDDGLRAAQRLIDQVGPVDGRTAAAIDLFRATLDGVPAVVLQVMRLKRTGTMPLTLADGHPVLSGEFPSVDQLRRFLKKGATEPAVLVTSGNSAVDFPTASRIHMSIFVRSLKESVAFYELLFGQPPTKLRDDYAKFEVIEPPLNLALSQERVPAKGGFVNHLGIQVKSSDVVLRAKERFVAAGFHVEEELATACCYSVQSKIWVGDPDGNRWEWFVTTQADAEEGCGEDCPCYAEIVPSRVGAVTSSMRVSA